MISGDQSIILLLLTQNVPEKKRNKKTRRSLPRLTLVKVKHEVQLPVRPPISMEVPVEPETAEDSFMYQAILIGMQTAIDLHIRAVLETVRNDTLHAFFTSFYL